jgi:hypothetical protein
MFNTEISSMSEIMQYGAVGLALSLSGIVIYSGYKLYKSYFNYKPSANIDDNSSNLDFISTSPTSDTTITSLDTITPIPNGTMDVIILNPISITREAAVQTLYDNLVDEETQTTEDNFVNVNIQTDHENLIDVNIQTDNVLLFFLQSRRGIDAYVQTDIIPDLMLHADAMNIQVEEREIYSLIQELIDNGSINELESVTNLTPESFRRTYITGYQENRVKILNWLRNQNSINVEEVSLITPNIPSAVLGCDTEAQSDSLSIEKLNEIHNLIDNEYSEYHFDPDTIKDLIFKYELTNKSVPEIVNSISNLIIQLMYS